jgi:hypothetical protein
LTADLEDILLAQLDATTFVDRAVTGGEDIASLIGVPREQVSGVRVQLLWEDTDVDEALSIAAALRASGAFAEADAVVRAVVVACAPHRARPADVLNRPH